MINSHLLYLLSYVGMWAVLNANRGSVSRLEVLCAKKSGRAKGVRAVGVSGGRWLEGQAEQAACIAGVDLCQDLSG